MTHLVFLLEERSAAAMLEGLLPRLLPAGISFHCIPFEGKQDLEKQLARRLLLYRKPGARFVVLRDQDAADCHVVKQHLTDLCREGQRPDALIRIACKELESWYLADLAAVEKALRMRGLARQQQKRKFRNPDALRAPSRELSLLAGGSYQKISGSRAIGLRLDLRNRRSSSFRVFIEGILRLVDQRENG